MSFQEFSEKAWPLPENHIPHRCLVSAHGMSLAGEHPIVCRLTDWEECGADGIFEPNMALCFESFIGSKDGGEGVKPEEYVLLTETGADRLSIYGYDEDWCRSEPESQPRIPV